MLITSKWNGKSMFQKWGYQISGISVDACILYSIKNPKHGDICICGYIFIWMVLNHIWNKLAYVLNINPFPNVLKFCWGIWPSYLRPVIWKQKNNILVQFLVNFPSHSGRILLIFLFATHWITRVAINIK